MADSMKWGLYFKERFPVVPNLLVAGGLAASAGRLAPEFSWAAFAVAMVGAFLFTGELRLMDEIKDLDKDRVAHPERPLPRGLLTTTEVGRALRAVAVGMFVFAGLAALMGGWCSGALYALVTVYLLLMYREFFVGDWLGRRPLLYAISHQIVIVGLCFFAVDLHPGPTPVATTFSFSWLILGSFFAYEICRKLDPSAHPILKTYLSVYGPRRSWALYTLCAALSAWGAYGLGIGPWLWPLQGALVLSGALLVWKPSRFKVVEGLATLSLLAHLWILVALYSSGAPK